MTIPIILLAILVLAAIATVATARLLRAVIALALTSAVLAVIMFWLQSPIAAVFELSVCAGLIPAIFITSIGLTQRLSPEALTVRKAEKLQRFWFLPLIVILAGIAMTQLHAPHGLPTSIPNPTGDVRNVLWLERHLDLLGQIVVLLGGVFAVIVLIVESKHE